MSTNDPNSRGPDATTTADPDAMPTPLDPTFPNDLTLYDGPMAAHTANGILRGTGQVWLSNIADLDVRWMLTPDTRVRHDGGFDLDDVELHIDHPELGPVTFSARATHSTGAGYVQHATLRHRPHPEPDTHRADSTSDNAPGVTPGADAHDSDEDLALDHVDVHWFGLPTILPATPLTHGSTTYGGRWTWAAHGWHITFDQRPSNATTAPTDPSGPDVSDTSDTSTTDPVTRRHRYVDPRGHARPIAMTHVARLRRQDGTFTPDEARHALEIWRITLSFALGRWVSPAIPVGFDTTGTRVWEEWANYRCTPPGANFNWWDNMRSDELGQVATLLFDAATDPDRFTMLRHAIHHAVSASSDRTTLEARVMLAQAGCEYLTWVLYAPPGRAARKEYANAGAASHLTHALTVAGIPTALPADLPAIAKLAPEDKQTGPDAVTWIRNRLVHPKDPAEPYRVEHALSDCWLLLNEYLDLLILHTAGYGGHYLPRRAGRWAHDHVSVPWNTTPKLSQ